MAKISLRSYGKEIEGLIDRGQYDQALAHCRHILRYYPKHIDTYRLMAKAYLEATRYGDASDVFQRVLSSIPDDFVSHLGMSIIREDEGNLDAAIWHMERAFEIQPANVAIQSEMRRLYGRRDGIEPPRVRLTRGALARMYYKGELYQQAISELRSALNADPSRTDLQVMLAQAYLPAGQRIEAVETCSAILKKLPYCLEANRILSEIMAGTERAQDAAIYRQRAIAMNPYLGQVSPKAPNPEQVPDEAVLVEKLDLKSEPVSTAPAQPQWAASLGVEIEAGGQKKEEIPVWLSDLQGVTQPSAKEKEDEAPTSQKVSPFVVSAFEENPELASYLQESSPTAQESSENLIPDWMKEAGWSPTKESSKEAQMGYSFGEGTTPEEEGLARAEIPEWLKAIAPKEAFERPQEPEEVDQRLLDALDSAAAPWLEETPPGAADTIASWLEEKEIKPAPSEPSDEQGLPDWLVGGAALAAAGLAASRQEDKEEAPPLEETPAVAPFSEVPEWLTGETAVSAGAAALAESESPASFDEDIFTSAAEPSPWSELEAAEAEPAADIPEWLSALEPAQDEPEKTEPADSNLPEWLAATAAFSQMDQAEEAPAETAPEWLSELEPAEQPLESSVTQEEEASAYAWLEELTAQQIPEDASFPAGEDAEEMAGWEPEQGAPEAAEAEGISAWEAAGLGAALGAAAMAASEGEEEPGEEEAVPAESFEEGEWVPEAFEPEGAAEAASDLFEPEGKTELAPEDVLPEWLRQVNPEAIQPAEGTPSPEDASLPLWLQQMQSEAEPETVESLWSQPAQEEVESEAEADLSWLPKVPHEPETMDEWLRSEAPAGEAGGTGEILPFAEKFADEELAGEEAVWLSEEFREEQAPEIEKGELPEWLAGLAVGAAAGAIIGKEGESQPPEQEEAAEDVAAPIEMAAPTELAIEQAAEEETLEGMEAALPAEELSATEIPTQPAEAEYEVPDWLETLEKPAEVAGAAILFGATREEEPAAGATPLEEASVEDALTQEGLLEEAAEAPSEPAMSDEDAAFAWLESLAVKQGATEALMFSEEERQEEPPEWVKQASQEEAVEPAASEMAAEPPAEVVEGSAGEGVAEKIEEPEEEAPLPDWLLAAAAAGALTAREKEQALPEETQPTRVTGQERETAAPEEGVEVAGEVESTATESDIESAYAWLEGLAVRQGAEEALLLTPEERQEEPPEWVKAEAAAEAEGEPVSEETPTEEGGRLGLVGAALAGVAAATGEEDTPIEEIAPSVEAEAEPAVEEEAPEEEIPGLPGWLADLEQGSEENTSVKDWTPEQAAMTQPLEKFDVNVPGEIPEQAISEVEHVEPAAPRLDINTASLVELERLPGVGFVRAEALIEYRAANGPFESMMDLENVGGFDPDLVDALREYATILPHAREITGAEAIRAGEVSLTNARQALHQGDVDVAVGIYHSLMSDTDLLPEVVKDLNDALYRYPVDVSIWMTLGDAEMRSGQTQEALDAYTKAEELIR